MRCNAGDVHGSGGDVDKEQVVVRDETFDRADFDAQKIRRPQTLPVSLQKRRPSGMRVSRPRCRSIVEHRERRHRPIESRAQQDAI